MTVSRHQVFSQRNPEAHAGPLHSSRNEDCPNLIPVKRRVQLQTRQQILAAVQAGQNQVQESIQIQAPPDSVIQFRPVRLDPV